MKRLFLTAILILLALFLSGCNGKATNRERPVPKVVVEEVKLSAVESKLLTKGIVEPWKLAKLSFQTAGKIREGPLETGTLLSEGAVVASLDNSDYVVQMEAARHQMDLAAVDSERTSRDLDRCERLFSEGAISQKNLDDARDQYKAALAKAGQAASAFKQAALMVEHSTLKAPFAGIILDRLSEQGEMVAAGTPVVVLGQKDRVKVVITVPSGQINAWKEGSNAAVIDQTGRQHQAAVHKVSPGADGYTGSFEVEIAVANPDDEFSPGQVVAVERKVESGQGLWVTLKSVVSYGEELKYIFVVNTGNNSVSKRFVKLGPLVGDKVQVLEGIKAGDRVVAIVPENLREGDRVEVK